MSEFQINLRNPHRMASLLRRKAMPSIIEAHIELADEERAFIERKLDTLLEDLAWRTLVPGSQSWHRSVNALATELRVHEPAVRKHVTTLRPVLVNQLNQRLLTGKLTIQPNGQAYTSKNELLELIFSAFYPKHIGVIDYHSAHRNYAREELGGINLNLDQEEERLRTTSLYNAANKYSNIKSEMAAEYVKQTLMEINPSRAIPIDRSQPIAETLQELFSSFFPGKKFLGPVPTEDGNLGFPVELHDGITHDINDLSSGEKEILFGYLRIRNSAPGYSIVLMDEPELHLNPALIRGLPQFYHKRLSVELSNQVWLVTHSDTFLREAIGHKGLRVFHMRHAVAIENQENQIHEIKPGEEVESIIMEMVGNLASYSPGSKIVFFEGENSDFDLRMVSRLFPTIENELNLVSGGNRFRVEMLHKTLEKSVQVGKIPVKIYSVVDKDTGPVKASPQEFSRHFTWDMYHIENYLLEPVYIDEALGRLNISHSTLSSMGKIDQCLRQIANEQINKLALHKLTSEVNTKLLKDLRLQTNPMSSDIGADFHKSIEKVISQMSNRLTDDLDVDKLRSRVNTERAELTESLKTDDWKKYFRGRDILSVFAGRYVPGMRYEYIRDLIISQMSSTNYQPEGMKSVLDQILKD